jgi:hypothetical protein
MGDELTGREVAMDNASFTPVIPSVESWITKHNYLLVVFLSILHVGLAFIHTRDSGGADLLSAS